METKPCPACGQLMPQSAFHCARCNHVIPVSAPVSAEQKRRNRAIYLVLGAVLFAGLFAVSSVVSPTNNGEPLLQVSGSKGPLGIQLVNREPGTVSACTVTLLDQGDAEWVASLPGSMVRSQTVRVNWSEFKDNGQPMPSSIGVARSNFIISCHVEAADRRRSAGLHF